MYTRDFMEKPKWTGCDFCGADETLHCMGDIWLCPACATTLQEDMYSHRQFSWEKEYNFVFESDLAPAGAEEE